MERSCDQVEKIFRYDADIWAFQHRLSQHDAILSIDLEPLTSDQDRELMEVAQDFVPPYLYGTIAHGGSWREFRRQATSGLTHASVGGYLNNLD